MVFEINPGAAVFFIREAAHQPAALTGYFKSMGTGFSGFLPVP
jgi:hypothetical protein